MNGDLAFTISDVWLILKFLWLLPAKAVIGIVHAEAQMLGRFLELTCDTGAGWGGAIFSFFIWYVAFLLFAVALSPRHDASLSNPRERAEKGYED